MKLIKNYNKLDNNDKFAIIAGAILLIIFVLSLWKQGIWFLGFTGSSGNLMPFLHHSRVGALMILIGIAMVLKFPTGTPETIGIFLIIFGIVMLFQHLLTERCFTVVQSLYRTNNLPAGGFC